METENVIGGGWARMVLCQLRFLFSRATKKRQHNVMHRERDKEKCKCAAKLNVLNYWKIELSCGLITLGHRPYHFAGTKMLLMSNGNCSKQ